MGRRVYLFELDSVRKTDDEIIKGQKALFDEITVNGNIAVLTYNQVVDSKAFFSLFRHEEYAEMIMNLFNNGAIKISRYGDVRSLSQYLINSVESEKEFIYSALPIKYSQKHLLALMKRCLQYSDLQEIYDYYSGKRNNDEVIDLFEEVDSNGNICESSIFTDSIGNERTKEETVIKMKEILRNLYWLLSIVLRLSTMHKIYIDPRDESEYRDLKLFNLLEMVTEIKTEDLYFNEAIGYLKKLDAYKPESNNRSVYLRDILNLYNSISANENEKGQLKRIFQYLEAIVNLCYNYACEISISNTSKHYNSGELKKGVKRPTFESDFFNRLNQDVNDFVNADNRYLQNEHVEFIEFKKLSKLPDFKAAVRYTDYAAQVDEAETAKILPRYEQELRKERKIRKNAVICSIAIKIGIAVFCVFLSWVIESVLSNIEEAIDGYILVSSILKTILFLTLSEYVTGFIAEGLPQFMSLSEAMRDTFTLLKDFKYIISKKSFPYENDVKDVPLENDAANVSNPVEYVIPKELKKYKNFAKDKKNSECFAESDIYPIADCSNQSVIKKVIRYEESYNRHFGIIHNSPYTKLIVDPIMKGDIIFPYERSMSSRDDDGVVMLTVSGDKFVILNQFRHSIRKNQYSFPRGFAEKGFTPVENACRELSEELNAKIKKEPELLGRVISDSGLTKDEAYVYFVELESFKISESIHEGIVDVVEIPFAKMDEWIADGNLNDGFSLSAYALYKAKCK